MTTQVTDSKLLTGRVVAIVTIVVGLVGAATPVIANMDFSSTAGIVAGIVAMSAVIVKYLDGWQKHEARQAVASTVEVAPATGEDTPATDTEQDSGAGLASVTPIGTSGPNGSPGAAVALVDPEEPDAPVPGEPDTLLELVPGDEVSDVPGPPTDDEIAAVQDELAEALQPARRAA